MESKPIALIPIQAEHTVDLYELWSDFEVIRFTYMPLLKDMQECMERVNMFVERNGECESPQHFSILCGGRAIGIGGFPAVNAEKGEYGFYYQLARRCWGKGLGFGAAKALLEYIKASANATCIYADAVPLNPASVAILMRLGFERTHVCGARGIYPERVHNRPDPFSISGVTFWQSIQ